MTDCNHVIGYHGFCGEMNEVRADFDRNGGVELQDKFNYCPICGAYVRALSEECDATYQKILKEQKIAPRVYVLFSSTTV